MLKILLSDSEKSSNLFWDDPVLDGKYGSSLPWMVDKFCRIIIGWQVWIIPGLGWIIIHP